MKYGLRAFLSPSMRSQTILDFKVLHHLFNFEILPRSPNGIIRFVVVLFQIYFQKYMKLATTNRQRAIQ